MSALCPKKERPPQGAAQVSMLSWKYSAPLNSLQPHARPPPIGELDAGLLQNVLDGLHRLGGRVPAHFDIADGVPMDANLRGKLLSRPAQ